MTAVHPITSLLFDLLLKSAMLLALAATVTQLWLRASAATRHAVWVAVMVTLLLLPVSRLAAPRWTFPLPGSVPVAPTIATPAAEPVIIRTSAGVPGAAQLTHSPVAVHIPVAGRRQLPSWENVLAGVWIGGALLVLARRFAGARRVRALRRESTPLVDAPVEALAADAAAALGVRTCELRESVGCRVPLTWGTWRPVVMLPITAREWPASRLLAAVRHEFAHVGRRDHLTRLLAQLACALYWPNPSVWLAARALRTAQEQACDDLVLRAGTQPDDYAAQLFALSRMLAAPGAAIGHAVAMAQPSTLEQRVRAIVDSSRNRAPASLAATLAIGVCAAALSLLSAVAQVGAEPLPESGLPELHVVPRQQVEVRAEFIELPAAEFDALFPEAKSNPAHLGILSSQDVASLHEKLEPLTPANYLEEVSASAENKVLGVPHVTTRDGQRAVIEIIRECRIAAANGESETLNEGITLELDPRLRSDGLHLSFRASLRKLRPGAPEPLTRDSFHLVDFRPAEPDGLHLRAGECGVFGGWETAHPGRKLLMLIEGRAAVLTLGSRLEQTVLPEVRLAGGTVREAADYLARAAHLSIITRPDSNERKVTLSLRNVSAAQALRELARAAGLRVYVDADAVYVVEPLPAGALEQANAIVLPEVKLTGVLLPEALDKLTALARQQHPEAAVRIHRQVPPDFRSPPLTIAMTNTPLSTAIAVVAELVGCELSATGDALYIHQHGEAPAGATRLLAPEIGTGLARVANEAEMAAENIAVDVKFIDVAVEQLAAIGVTPAGDAPADTFLSVFTAEKAKDFLQQLRNTPPGGGKFLTAQRVKTSSGIEALIEIDTNLHPDDPPQPRLIETAAVTVIATLGPDGKTLDLNLAPFFTERRAATNEPVFSTRKIPTAISIFSGQTVTLMPRIQRVGRAQLLLITASVLPP